MSEYMHGLLTGAATTTTVLLIIGTILSRLDHEAWMRICDRYDAELARRKPPEPSDN